MVATLRELLSGGSGDLSLLQVPLSLLRYWHLFRLSPGALDFAAVTTSGDAPLLVSDLVLDSATLAGQL